MLKPVLSSLLLSISFVCASAQNDLPAAPTPSAPSKPDFSMPAATPHKSVYAPPSAETAPPPADTSCTAPSDAGFRIKQELTAFQMGELKDFISAFTQRLGTEWKRRMPRAVNDPWIQGKSVLLRFEILPNGMVRNSAIMMSSGRNDYDDHVLRSLIAAQPYPLPDDFKQLLSVCLNFHYNPRQGDPLPVDPFAAKPHKSNP